MTARAPSAAHVQLADRHVMPPGFGLMCDRHCTGCDAYESQRLACSSIDETGRPLADPRLAAPLIIVRAVRTGAVERTGARHRRHGHGSIGPSSGRFFPLRKWRLERPNADPFRHVELRDVSDAAR